MQLNQIGMVYFYLCTFCNSGIEAPAELNYQSLYDGEEDCSGSELDMNLDGDFKYDFHYNPLYFFLISLLLI